jgi:hypothetical protein
MSHHFDSPTAIADGRLNLGDVFVFSGQGSRSNLILTMLRRTRTGRSGGHSTSLLPMDDSR